MIDWLIWAAAGVSLLLAEIIFPRIFLGFLGFAACATGALTWLFGMAFAAQMVGFAGLAMASLAFGLRARGPAPAEPAPGEPAVQSSLVGRHATALVFEGRNGRVRLGDIDWPARVPSGIAPPDPGARMRVERIDGTVVIVRPEVSLTLKETP